MPIITMPDGQDVAFPDDMPAGQIRGMIQLKFPTALQQEQKTAEPKTRSAGQVASEAVRNIPGSAVEFGKNLVQPILHPIDTATSIKDIGLGVLEQLGIVSGKDHVKHSEAVGNFLMNRYGGIEEIKNTLATDPVGLMADLSLILTGGGSIAARAPGMIGRVGEATAAVGRIVDPLTVPLAAAKGAAGATSQVLGVTTGAGSRAIETAARSGFEGGEAGQAFRDSLLGRVPLEAVVADAKGAVQQLRQERGAEYLSSMKEVGADKTILNFDKIDEAIAKVSAVKTYKGQDLSPSTSAVRQNIWEKIREWKVLDPKEFHTAEGLDALKQKIGDIRDAAQYGTPERVVADQMYKAIRQTIVDQVPEYGKIMKGYEQASSIIKEIEGTLSLKPDARIDTSLRKLQSVLRDNVNANYGQRSVLAKYLVNAGAPHLIESLAGQALSKWTPRGLGPLLAIGAEGGLGGLIGSTAGVGAAAKVAPALGAASPKLVGLVAHGLGMLSRPAGYIPLRSAASASFQLGRSSLIPQ